MEKKNPYKFTLGFDKTKPTHVRAAEILNSVRDKADLIASAVVAHIDGGSTEKGGCIEPRSFADYDVGIGKARSGKSNAELFFKTGECSSGRRNRGRCNRETEDI